MFLQIFNDLHRIIMSMTSVNDDTFLSQWAWFSMSTRNLIGSGQNSAHPLPDRDA